MASTENGSSSASMPVFVRGSGDLSVLTAKPVSLNPNGDLDARCSFEEFVYSPKTGFEFVPLFCAAIAAQVLRCLPRIEWCPDAATALFRKALGVLRASSCHPYFRKHFLAHSVTANAPFRRLGPTRSIAPDPAGAHILGHRLSVPLFLVAHGAAYDTAFPFPFYRSPDLPTLVARYA